MKRLHWLIALVALTAMVACTPRGLQPQDIPTRASLDDLATSMPLTQNAPPTPYNGTVTAFSSVDNGLANLAGWRYVVQLNFQGTFSDTPRTANASAQAEVSFNQLGSSRHLLVNTSGELIGQTDNTSYEVVQLAPDDFLVRGGACEKNTPAAKTTANLQAGQLVGGVSRVTPGGKRATINGQDVYFYTFDASDLILPSIRIGDGGAVNMNSSEMWISPANNAVVRFYLNLDLKNVVIFDKQLPVSGQMQIRYDLYDIGNAFNITTPFGC